VTDRPSNLSLNGVLETALTEVYALILPSIVGSVPVASTAS